ncbi:MAG: hypothetical protein KatS3mg104_2347 [Phycisphaerae bacterium]|jgi:2-C-methyl-D-erythritol 2,4-cyclodiphosphate synthase|nr:MAG: hypothetical protein KatS3mg104_2347 [Phycisphaerae bacterium]
MDMDQSFRIGLGYDIHRIEPGGRLILGGVVVSEELHAVAHSDGDVVIHALVDAILGAMGKGDIGEMFPNSDPRWKGASSLVFLEQVLQLMKASDFAVVNADLTVQAERPRLKEYKPLMQKVLEEKLGAPVGVKAGTNESCDSVGQGQAISAQAVVLLRRV